MTQAPRGLDESDAVAAFVRALDAGGARLSTSSREELLLEVAPTLDAFVRASAERRPVAVDAFSLPFEHNEALALARLFAHRAGRLAITPTQWIAIDDALRIAIGEVMGEVPRSLDRTLRAVMLEGFHAGHLERETASLRDAVTRTLRPIRVADKVLALPLFGPAEVAIVGGPLESFARDLLRADAKAAVVLIGLDGSIEDDVARELGSFVSSARSIGVSVRFVVDPTDVDGTALLERLLHDHAADGRVVTSLDAALSGPRLPGAEAIESLASFFRASRRRLAG